MGAPCSRNVYVSICKKKSILVEARVGRRRRGRKRKEKREKATRKRTVDQQDHRPLPCFSPPLPPFVAPLPSPGSSLPSSLPPKVSLNCALGPSKKSKPMIYLRSHSLSPTLTHRHRQRHTQKNPPIPASLPLASLSRVYPSQTHPPTHTSIKPPLKVKLKL